jgi:hypothetical protein
LISTNLKIIERLDSSEFPTYSNDLQTCIDLFEDRNELIHGRIYANADRPETLKSGRPNNPDREVSSEELYNLATELYEFSIAIYAQLIFKVPRAVAKYVNKR